MTFGADGIGVIRYVGELPRILPWTSVVAQVVEQWRGGAIPEWWVDPELNRGEAAVWTVQRCHRSVRHQPATPPRRVGSPDRASRRLLASTGSSCPEATRATCPNGFTGPRRPLPGAGCGLLGDPGGRLGPRRRTPEVAQRPPQKPATWVEDQALLSVALVVFVGICIALILLQSAGTIHLPSSEARTRGRLFRPSGRSAPQNSRELLGNRCQKSEVLS
jgi:hypothetical protein